MGNTQNKYELLASRLIQICRYLSYAVYRPNLNLALLFFLLTTLSIGNAQDIDFTLKYNSTDNQYEVFGKANNSQPNFFVGGGSQLSVVLPARIANSPLVITTVSGGIWTDNSQIFAPAATPTLDYHGVASNGSFMDFIFGEETLLFTFSIPNENCVDGIRLFENANDPSSSEPSMNGADFQNYFANAFTFVNHYRANYNNTGISCSTPTVFIPPITTPINVDGQSCGTIININTNANHTATICEQPSNGTTTVSINNATNQICLDFVPNPDFTGQDSVCIEICDENLVCVEAMVLLNVFGTGTGTGENDTCSNQTIPIITTNAPICMGDQIVLQTTDFGTAYTYVWTNANNETIGQTATLNIASDNNQAIAPFRVTRTRANCLPVSSLPVEVSITDFARLTVQNNGPVCVGSSVELLAAGFDGGTYTWFLAGTNTQVAVGPNPTINNINIITTYRLEVSYNGCQNNRILETTVSVDPKPNISNLLRSITVCRGEDVLITPINEPATGEDIRYIWKGPNDFLFKNNTTSDTFPLFLENISPEQAGAYSIDITSENGCEVDSRSIIINVVDELEAPILIASETLICSGNNIEITATEQDDANVDFEWFIQQDNEALTFLQTTNQPTLLLEGVNNDNSGKYLVRTTKDGCVSGFSNTIVITVFDTFTTVEAANNGPVCEGEAVQLAASAIPGAVYNWFVNDDLVATGQTAIIQNVLTTTTYDLSVSLSDCQTSSTAQTTVNIAPKPTITNLTETRTHCVGSDVVLLAQNSPALGQEIFYTWTGPNDFSFSGMTTSDSFELEITNITIEKSGAYNLTLTSGQGCETDIRSTIVNVNNELTAPALIPLNTIICGGNPIQLTASLQNNADVDFEWFIQNEEEDLFLLDITNVPSIVIENPTPANSGKYLVRVRKGDCLSGFSNTEIITVLDEVTSNIAATNSTDSNNPVCTGDFVQLSVPFFAEATYKWFGPAGFAANTYNPFINPVTSLNAGDYFAVISIEGCTGIVSAPTTVFINEDLATPIIIGDSLLCEGETLILEVSEGMTSSNDEPPMVIWYNAVTNQVIDTTNDNRLQILNASPANSGAYYAILIANGCESDASNIINVAVSSRSELMVDAGENLILCTAGTITLAALPVAHTNGKWSSPTGATIANPTETTTPASNLSTGDNLFVWTLQDACGQIAIDTVVINVAQTTGDIANAGSDQNICEVGAINLNATALEESIGIWRQSIDQINQGAVIVNPNDPNTEVIGLLSGNVYQFTWTLSANNCPDFAVDEVFITINEEPEEIAFISEQNATINICEGTQIQLTAEMPLFSTGRWTTTSNVSIVNPTLPETMVGGLPVGQHIFVWTLSNQACTDFSSDTVIVNRGGEILANPDAYVLSLEDSVSFNLLENDLFTDFENLTLTITKFPEKGTLREDGNGQFTFFSERTVFGNDDFRYKLCSNFCESVCDTAIVDITILGSGAGNDCFIPNVLSPNGDDINDQLLIGCIDLFPDASIQVFSRWGDIVYEAAPYFNDWEGTYKGRPLPAGTYFYSIKLTPESTPLQDFITIFR